MTTKATVCANGPDCYTIMIPRILPNNHVQAPSFQRSITLPVERTHIGG